MMNLITSHLTNEQTALLKAKANELFPPGLGINGIVGPVYKRRAKIKSEKGYPDEMRVMTQCSMSITGYVSDDGKVYVWPVFSDFQGYFKTSPVESVKVVDGKLIIETQNSTYEVEL